MADGGETALRRRSPEQFFDRSPDPIVEYEIADGRVEVAGVNPAFEELFGCVESAVVGDPLDEVARPVGHDAGHDGIILPDRPVEEELRCRTIEGVRVFLLRSVPTEEGDQPRGFGIYTDISEHKRVEQRFSALVNSSSDLLTILDRDGTFSYVSPSVTDLLGYDPEDLVGEQALGLIHPDDRETVTREFFEDPLEWAGETRSATYRIEHADGGWRIIESAGRSRLHDPAVEGVVFNSRDVTEREHRKTELELYETIVETVPVGVIVLDEDGEVRKINERGASMLGLRSGELEGRAFTDLVEWGMVDRAVVEEYLDTVEALRAAPADAERKIPEAAVTTAGGTEKVVDIHVGLLPFEEEFRGTVSAFRDITERKAYERELERQNQQLEEFAHFVSHDLRNPLNVAQGYLDAALRTGDEESIREVKVSLDRMEELIGDLLALARHGDDVEDPAPVAVDEVVESAWSTVATAGADLTVETDAVVRADEGQFRQLLENLIRNSVEHGSTGSRPEADDSVEHGSTGSRSKGSGDAVEHAGEDVSIRVGLVDRGFFFEDDGPGIPEENREEVLNVGFTTESDGTGFGLGIVDQIADAHGWDVTVTEGTEGGARFEVTGVEFD